MMPIALRSLQTTDRSSIFAWAEVFLNNHLKMWTDAYGLSWSEEKRLHHIAEHAMREGIWEELEEDSQNCTDAFVSIAYRSEDPAKKPCGILHMQTREDPYLKFSVGVLSWAFVSETNRGLGVAQTLMDAGDAWLKACDLSCSEVFATLENPRAIAFYERQGFRQVDTRMFRSFA